MLNLYGTWRVTQAFLQVLLRSEHPRVVTVASGAGSHGDPAYGLTAGGGSAASYGVSKAAVLALTATLAAELADSPVLVTAVDPDLTATWPGAEAMGARPAAEKRGGRRLGRDTAGRRTAQRLLPRRRAAPLVTAATPRRNAAPSAAVVAAVANKMVLTPGPRHPITVEPSDVRVVVRVDGRVIADTRSALTLREADYPAVHYIPREDVDMTALERVGHESYCPFKGEASYYSIPAAGDRGLNAVWTYEAPYDAVSEIKDHLAFYANRVDALEELPL